MDAFWQDLQHAVRVLRRSPGFTAVVLLTLALGIGANTAIFSVVHAVVLKPLPYPDPERLVVFHTQCPTCPGHAGASSIPDFDDWRAEPGVFERMAISTYWTFNLTGRDIPERIIGARASGEFFPTLAPRPLLGRTLTPEDDKPGTPEAVVLSYSLWQRAFGGDPAVLGRVLTLNGRPHTVAGVMGPEFRFPQEDIHIWAALKDNLTGMQRHNRFLFVFGRLAPGVAMQEAQSAMDVVAARLAREYPESNKGYTVKLVTAHETQVGEARTALLVLLGAVGCVLLIACANVANLLLARTAARQRENAIRASLGAGPGRLLRQSLTENLLLALTGGALGVALSHAGLQVLLQMHPGGLPRLDETGLDPAVFGFAFALALATGALLGLLPAWQASRADLRDSLQEGARSAGDRRHGRLRNALVTAEVAVAVVLLVGGGLLLRSFAKLAAVEPGFATRGVATMSVFLTPPGYRQLPERVTYLDNALTNLSTVPGVESVAVSTDPPLGDGWTTFSLYEEGKPLPVAEAPTAGFRGITEDYFVTLRIPLLAGRTFLRTDDAEAPKVLVVNEALARRLWPHEDAIGKRIRWADPQRDTGPLTIVGVVRDLRHRGLDQQEGPVVYGPIRQVTFPWMRWFSFVTRTAADPRPLIPALRAEVLKADPDKPVFDVRTMEEAVDASIAERRFHTLLLELFGALAVTLAVVGIYGVVSYSVTQRTQEIGLRMALGAQRPDVWRLVVGGGMAWTLAGVALGLGGALALTGTLRSLLFEVEPTDPATFAAVGATLLVVALAACWVPARRAMNIDPMVALRHE